MKQLVNKATYFLPIASQEQLVTNISNLSPQATQKSQFKWQLVQKKNQRTRLQLIKTQIMVNKSDEINHKGGRERIYRYNPIT